MLCTDHVLVVQGCKVVCPEPELVLDTKETPPSMHSVGGAFGHHDAGTQSMFHVTLSNAMQQSYMLGNPALITCDFGHLSSAKLCVLEHEQILQTPRSSLTDSTQV